MSDENEKNDQSLAVVPTVKTGEAMVEIPMKALKRLLKGDLSVMDLAASAGMGAGEAEEMAGNLDLLLLANFDRIKEARDLDRDYRDVDIYTAGIIGGHDSINADSVQIAMPLGTEIPSLIGVVRRTREVERLRSTHTNLRFFGQLGNSFGDAAVRAVGVYIERSTAGEPGHGAVTPDDLEQIRNKVSLKIEVAGRTMFEAPLRHLDFSLDFMERMIPPHDVTVDHTAQEEFQKTIQEPETERWVQKGARGLRIPILIAERDTVGISLEVPEKLTLTPGTSGKNDRGVLIYVRMLATVAKVIR